MISDRALWQRARPLFDELVEADDGTRRARLEEIGRADPVLREAVERLLAADREAASALRDYGFVSRLHDAAGVADARDPLGVVGRTVSHFRVTDYLAAGGMGVVYRAEDLQLGRTVALKFPLPHHRVGPAVRDRFVNEARSAGALDHPNLCTVHEIGESEHGLFLAMPLYAGETLKEHLARRDALPPDEALAIAVQVTSGVAAAHAAGIVHRDLKPGNVMLLPDGAVKVLDFGLAKIRDVDLTKSLVTLGTIGYVAPEQIRGRPADARADLWAIGVMLHEMVTGALPFRGEHEMAVMHAVLHEEPPRPTAVNARLPRAFDDVIGALLQKDPADRYQSADALLADLAALQRGVPLARRAPFWSRSPRRRRVRKAILPAAALLLLGGGGWEVARRRAAAAVIAPAAAPTWIGDTAFVADGAELMAALVPANAGRRIHLRAGTYDVDRPLVVPDGMTLSGAGVMRFGDDGLPIGFADDTRPTIRMTANTGGDVLTLGDGVTVRNVEIEDLTGRSGNVVSVGSRRAGDTVSVTLLETVIVNPNQSLIGSGGSLGRGLHVATLNPNMGADPAPHEGATLAVRVLRSVIRSPADGGGLFAFNFAARGSVSVELSRSVIGGTNEANGGVSRPDQVHDAEVRVTSQGNLYRNDWMDPCTPEVIGWNLLGGSDAPIKIALRSAARNRLVFRSVDDRIEGFTTGVLATAGRRYFPEPLNAGPSDNRIDLQLIGTRFSTPACGTPDAGDNLADVPDGRSQASADLRLIAASAEREGITPGSRNVIRAELLGLSGSGRRANVFSSARGPSGDLPARLQGEGNRLEIVGDRPAFARQNSGIDPAPAVGFFIGERSAAAAITREPLSASSPRDRADPPPRRTP